MNYTSLERHKSAPYLRLKNSKRTWKSQKTQSIKLTKRVSNSRKTQTTELARQVPDKRPCIKCCKTSKNWRGTLWWKKIQKVSQFRKNWKGALWDFSTSILSQSIKKLKGDPLGDFFFEKSLNAEKYWKGNPLVSPGTVCYAEKEEKLFWFSSAGQMIQFGTIKFRRTFKN